MDPRAAVYTIRVHTRRKPEDLKPLGDIDDSGTYLGIFEGLPIALLLGCGISDVELPKEAYVALPTVTGLLSAFLFGAMLQVSAGAIEWAESAPQPARSTSRHAILLVELAAKRWLCVPGKRAGSDCVRCGRGHLAHRAEVFSAIGLGLALHMALVLSMVTIRVCAVAHERLLRARTGADVAH